MCGRYNATVGGCKSACEKQNIANKEKRRKTMKQTTWVLETWRIKNGIPCKRTRAYAEREQAVKAFNGFKLSAANCVACVYPVTTWAEYPNGRTHKKQGSVLCYKDSQHK